MTCLYQYQLYPNEEQKRLIEIVFGCTRFIYNYYIQKRKELYEKEHVRDNTFNYSEDIAKLKKEKIFLKNIDSTALKSAIQDCDRDYNNFVTSFNNGAKVEYPKYKTKKAKIQKYKVQQVGTNIKILEKKIKLPKLGEVNVKPKNVIDASKIINEKIISVTVLKNRSGKYFADVLCEE